MEDIRFKAIETEAAESVASCLYKEREKEILENRQYVKALLKTTALLGRQGLAFRGHDEGESSANQGNFVETVHLLTEINPDLMKNSPKNELRKMRDDEYFRVLYGKSKEMAINVGADLSETSALSSAIPVKSKRVQKISGRLRDYLTTTTIGKHNIDSESTTTEDKMRREFYEVLDRVLNEFEERFSVQLPVLEATRCLNPKSKDFMDSDLLLVIATYFDQAGIDTMQLKCQALIARAFVSQLPQKPANALDVFERLGGLKEAYSELLKVVRVVLTLPLTTQGRIDTLSKELNLPSKSVMNSFSSQKLKHMQEESVLTPGTAFNPFPQPTPEFEALRYRMQLSQRLFELQNQHDLPKTPVITPFQTPFYGAGYSPEMLNLLDNIQSAAPGLDLRTGSHKPESPSQGSEGDWHSDISAPGLPVESRKDTPVVKGCVLVHQEETENLLPRNG
ncbi:hypothetical protein QYM36_006128 [Artemia franciscana]|uniref:DUF4371 domain-containing protein n=1 Tax=Artemia franciscana TaxID=6661 RepID=A0AA88HXL6_ARTSF|nr:hypothetical protein QYM36_006128 [Artemia franciscana]